MARILVTGGSGFLGRKVLAALVEQGHVVYALIHRHTLEIDGVTSITGDIDKPTELLEKIQESKQSFDIVLHMIGIIREKPPSITFQKLHTEATINIVTITQQLRIPKIVYISALGTGKNAPGPYFQSKYQSEEAIKSSGLTYIILRPSIIWDVPSEVANQLKYVNLLPFITLTPGKSLNIVQPILRKDLAAIISDIIEKPQAENTILEAGGAKKYTFRDFVKMTGRRKKFTIPIPLILLKVALRTADYLHIPLPITSTQLSMLQINNTVTTEKSVLQVTSVRPSPVFSA